ncbi:MAG: hypothetical protein HYV07_12175 [Deltaproteobacteria bacterium]|nr:hypothetical protein [Deltaproteobacteria bacterium]
MPDARKFIEALFVTSPGAIFELRAKHEVTERIASTYWTLAEIPTALAWSEAHSRAGWHVWIGVQPRIRRLARPSSESNVAGYGCLPLDFDDVESFTRALALLRAHGLEPSIAVSSGRGGHLYYLLDRLYPVAEAEPVALAIVRWTKIHLARGSDSVFSAQQVMRLPGTINHKPGVGILCTLLHLPDPELRYSLDRIAQVVPARSALPVPNGKGTGGRRAPSLVDDVQRPNDGSTVFKPTVERLAELRRIAAELPEYVHRLIREGWVDGGKYPSRSEADFAVICALVDAGLFDGEIVGVFEDVSEGIGRRMLEKGREVILRDIEKARTTERPKTDLGEISEIRIVECKPPRDGYVRLGHAVLSGPFAGRNFRGGLKINREVWVHALAALDRPIVDWSALGGRLATVVLRETGGKLEVARWVPTVK